MGASSVVRRKAAASALASGLIVVLSTAPASAQSTFTVADLSVPYGSGIVPQVITVSGTVVGTAGDLVITAVTGGGGLVAGLDVSPSTQGVCTQTYNNGYDVDWHCVPNPTWGSGTIAVLMDTGSPSGALPPLTRDWIDAETTTISDANVGGGQATGTVSLLAPTTPPAPTNPQPLPATPVTPKPGNTRAPDSSASPTRSGPTTAVAPPSVAAATSISPPPTGLTGASGQQSVGIATTTAPSLSTRAIEPAASSARASSFTAAASGIAAAVLSLGLALTALIRWRKRAADASPPEER